MATFLKEIPKEDLEPIRKELERQPVGINRDRKTSGVGRTQAFGIIKRMGYRPWVSRNCWMRIELWKHLLQFAEKHVPIPWKAVQVNMNYKSNPHYDKGNVNDSFIVGFNNYEGGELQIGETSYDLRYKAYLFNGSQHLHSNLPHTGTKFSLVFFDWKNPKWWDGDIPMYSIVQHEGKDMVRIEDIDNGIYLCNKKKYIILQNPTRKERPGLVSIYLDNKKEEEPEKKHL